MFLKYANLAGAGVADVLQIDRSERVTVGVAHVQFWLAVLYASRIKFLSIFFSR